LPQNADKDYVTQSTAATAATAAEGGREKRNRRLGGEKSV